MQLEEIIRLIQPLDEIAMQEVEAGKRKERASAYGGYLRIINVDKQTSYLSTYSHYVVVYFPIRTTRAAVSLPILPVRPPGADRVGWPDHH